MKLRTANSTSATIRSSRYCRIDCKRVPPAPFCSSPAPMLLVGAVYSRDGAGTDIRRDRAECPLSKGERLDRRAVTAIAIVVGLAAVATPIYLSVLWAERQSLNEQIAAVGSIADEILYRAEQNTTQVR